MEPVYYERLRCLRGMMKEFGLSGYLIPHEDAHLSEFVSESDKRIEFLTNFSGSSGFGLVTLQDALLFTDTRYEIQIKREVNSTYWKFGISQIFCGKEVGKYVKENFSSKRGEKLGVDPNLISTVSFQRFRKMLKKHQIELVGILPNFIDEIRKKEQSSSSSSSSIRKKKKKKKKGYIFFHEVKYSGETSLSKLTRIREKMKNYDLPSSPTTTTTTPMTPTTPTFFPSVNIDVLIISSLEEIGWTCNLRGVNLVPFCGTFPSFMIIEQEVCRLYVNSHLFLDEENMKQLLFENGITIRPYHQFHHDLKQLSKNKNNILMDPRKLNIYTSSSVTTKKVFGESPVIRMKMEKNETEIQGFRTAIGRDCAILVKFFRWIETELLETRRPTEFETAKKLEEFRERSSILFMCNSFETICSVGSNASVVHYHPQENSPDLKHITPNEVLLVDSGGHYKDGTSDTTRTRHFGRPTEEERKYYTYVLKGHFAFASLVFPKRMKTVYKMHIISRMPLWKVGYDYPHGTSHGVGTCLSVHEEPYLHGSYLPTLNCILTIEPGCYMEEKNFGIRIENMYAIRKHPELDGFYKMECLTFFPFQRKMIEKKFLNNEEIEWVDSYHMECRKRLLPFFEDDDNNDAKEWIINETHPL